MIAETPVKGTQAMRGQRKQVIVFPTADQAYTIRVRYWILPDALTNQMPYAYGGAQHSELILEACLAAAEFKRYGKLAEHNTEFQRLLQVSQRLDKRNKPQVMGQNDTGRNWWDSGLLRGNPRYGDLPPVTYAGGSY